MVLVLNIQLLLVLVLLVLLMVMVSRVLRTDPLDRALLLLLFEKRVRAEVSRLVRLHGRRNRRRLVRNRRQVFRHGVLEFFYGIRIVRRSLVATGPAVGFRRTGRQSRLARRRRRAQAREMLFPARHVFF